MRLRIFFAVIIAIVFFAWVKNSCNLLTTFTENNDALYPDASHRIGTEFKLAYEQSYGFFDDMSEREWNMQRVISNNMSHHPSNVDPFLQKENPAEWYQGNWNPDFSCLFRQAVGGPGDGLKWVCDPHRLNKDGCLVYSVGSAGNFDFEVGLNRIAPMCEIHTFDPADHTKDLKKYNAERFVHLHQWGLKPSYNTFENVTDTFYSNHFKGALNGQEMKTLKETMMELGHDARKIDVFKIDCEGCEWKTYKDWTNGSIFIQQILVEVHDTPLVSNYMFNELHDEGYVIFNKEPNIQFGGGRCVEYSFLKLNKDYFKK